MRTSSTPRPATRRVGVAVVVGGLLLAAMAALGTEAATAARPAAVHGSGERQAAPAVKTVRASVEFDSGSEDLDAAGRRVIRKLAAAIPDRDVIVSVRTVGRVQFESRGDQPRRAVQRAEAVSDFFTSLRPGGTHSVRGASVDCCTPAGRRATITVVYTKLVEDCPGGEPTFDLDPGYNFPGLSGKHKIAVKVGGGSATISYSDLPDWITATAHGLTVDTADLDLADGVPITVTATPKDDTCDVVTADTIVSIGGNCAAGDPEIDVWGIYSFDPDTGIQQVPVSVTGSITELQYTELPDWITVTDDGLDVDTDAAPPQTLVEITLTAIPRDPSCQSDEAITRVKINEPAPCLLGPPIIGVDGNTTDPVVTFDFDAQTGDHTLPVTVTGGQVDNVTADGTGIGSVVLFGYPAPGIIVATNAIDGSATADFITATPSDPTCEAATKEVIVNVHAVPVRPHGPAVDSEGRRDLVRLPHE